MIEKICPSCGRKFLAKFSVQKYCSPNCAVNHPTSKTFLPVAPIKISAPPDNDTNKPDLLTATFTEKICPVCGKKFMQTSARQKFCSAACREKYHEKPPLVEKTCPVCGKVFESNFSTKKYCSNKCKNKHHNDQRGHLPLVEKTCPFCGKKFMQDSPRQKFCSYDCQIKHNNDIQCAKRKAQKKSLRAKKTKSEKTCLYCGKKILSSRRDARYCSRVCANKAQVSKNPNKSKEIICLNCGEHFFVSPSLKRKFCSKKCVDEYYRKLRDKQNDSACEVRNKTCEICGAELPKGRQKYCSNECLKFADKKHSHGRRTYCEFTRKKRDPNRKTIEQWNREARQCGMSYGKYRAAINSGKTFDELKLPERDPSDEKILYECKI